MQAKKNMFRGNIHLMEGFYYNRAFMNIGRCPIWNWWVKDQKTWESFSKKMSYAFEALLKTWKFRYGKNSYFKDRALITPSILRPDNKYSLSVKVHD